MKEFLFNIKNSKDAKKNLTPEIHFEFIKECESYIGELKSKNQLIAAQPLVREGIVIKKNNNEWTQSPLAGNSEIQVGYYHIRANDMKEAIDIAKNNPEFAYVPSATIEVRQVKTREAETGFEYPSGK